MNPSYVPRSRSNLVVSAPPAASNFIDLDQTSRLIQHPTPPPHITELTVNSLNSNFALFEEDGTNRPPVASLLQDQSTVTARSAVRHDMQYGPTEAKPSRMTLNAITGVFLPVLQCMTGVLFFVRLPWIVGTSGIGYTISYLCVAATCTTLTSASISAVISNGINSAGGPYYLLSRTLGREVGGSIGILFFLSLISSVSLTVLGAVEVLREHILPGYLQFEDPKNTDRLTGFLTLTFLLFSTSLSWKITNRVVAAIGFVTFVSLFLILAGLISSTHRIPNPDIIKPTPTLEDSFLPSNDETFSPSLGNWINQFALFFPLVTGIMAGVNKSDLIRNAPKAVPRGMLAAIFVSGAAYITTVLLLGGIIQRSALRTQQLPILAIVTWPHPAVGYTSTLAAALGAAAQSSIGAQRLLRAFARDHLLGMNRVMALSIQWTPLLITFVLTMSLILAGQLDQIAPITTQCFLLTYAGMNAATTLGAFTKAPGWRPTWSMYHWTLSLFGTMLCVTLMFLISWWASLISVAVAILIFQVIELDGAQASWGADGLWSLSIQVAQRNLWRLESLPHQAGLWRPQILAMMPVSADANNTSVEQLHTAMAALVGQLKKGGGLSILCVCINDGLEAALNQQLVAKASAKLEKLVDDLHLEAFVQVIVARTYLDALIAATQATGVGFLRPNTIVQFFPVRRLPSSDSSYSGAQLNSISNTHAWTATSAAEFVECIRSVILLDKALLLVRGLHSWPVDKQQDTTIDVYWIVHDGGILRMLPWLLQRHVVWRGCRLRVFAVAQLFDNSIEMQRNLEHSLREARIDAEACVLELGDQDVSEFVHEMTVRMESRENFLQKVSLSASPAVRRRTASQGLLVQQLKSFHMNASAPIQRLLSNKQRPDFINTSVRLNSLMLEHSSKASMVLCNLPAPTSGQPPLDYIEYLETLCRGLPRIILTKGNGLELV